MSRDELLHNRGFRDEKHLTEFLDACKDESWKAELKEYFGLTKKEEKVEEPKEVEEPKNSKSKK